MRYLWALLAMLSFVVTTTGMARASVLPSSAMAPSMVNCHRGAHDQPGKTRDCCADGMAGCTMCCAIGVSASGSSASRALTPDIFGATMLYGQHGLAVLPALPPPRYAGR